MSSETVMQLFRCNGGNVSKVPRGICFYRASFQKPLRIIYVQVVQVLKSLPGIFQYEPLLRNPATAYTRGLKFLPTK